MVKNLSIILGSQLCDLSEISFLTKYPIFMCESDDLCNRYKFHQLKIIFFLSAMRNYRDELVENGNSCFYYQLQINYEQKYFDVLEVFCKSKEVVLSRAAIAIL